MIKIRLHEDYITNYPIGGVKDIYEEAAVKYMSNLTNWGCNRRRRIGNVIEVDLADNVQLDMVDFTYLMTRIDGDVIGFTPYIEVDDMSSLVPTYVPNAYKQINTGTEEEPVYEQVQKTWDEWVKPNYTRTEIDGKTWFLSYSGTDKAEPLTGDVIWDLELEDGVNIETSMPTIENPI